MRRLVVIAILGIACGKNGATPGSGSAGSAAPPGADGSTIVGSGGSADPNAGPDAAKIEAELAALEQLKMKTCACADLPCVEKVGLEHQAWKAKAKEALAGASSTPAQKERGNRLEDEMKACYRWVEAGLGSGAGGSEANAKIEIALVELERFRNKMCACTDSACANQVHDAMKAWEKAQRATMGNAKPDAKQMERGQLYEAGMKECRKRIDAGGGAAADPKIAARFDTAIAELGQLKTKMCGCKDKACAEKIDAEYKAWRTALKAELKGHKPSKEQDERGNKADRELKDCRDKLVN